ncbi:hypothetical protein ASPCADRAFT_405938 [Aspergillus carbonarius ITEM 5010]|uniref:Scytalone dehydratase-like domain-containing protein n=1 Tax=Aspergillus carbonarius (strain ITEM 5010) TaxID=602072 RepID=A0A1R3RKV0_ASPC5|nr:hypothetical protein ASPCADRAFT_5560 [Aspergillus carbonarius ITEM 5010]OOF95112.1 hypothetical protein ASPCADRAFT_405938 [Aspergillus carbonarius ITEM 5010]
MTTHPNILECQNLLYEWAESMDTKSWSKLQTILAPTISIDYTAIGWPKALTIPSTRFVENISKPTLLGNPEIQTQHFLGGCKWTVISETCIRVVVQLVAAHQRVSEEGDGRGVVGKQMFGRGVDRMELVWVDGGWKIAGLCVEVLWVEGDMQGIFGGAKL